MHRAHPWNIKLLPDLGAAAQYCELNNQSNYKIHGTWFYIDLLMVKTYKIVIKLIGMLLVL